jgi:hypothetical protein
LKGPWRATLSAALSLAFLAGQAEIAQHQFEHSHDTTHSSGSCAVCVFAQQTALTTSAELPMGVMVATGQTTTPELPLSRQLPWHFPFGPRSPPCVAAL